MTKNVAEFAETDQCSAPKRSEVKLYDASTIHTLPWPDSEVGHLAQAYWLPLMEAGASHYITNVETQVFAIAFDDVVLPMTVNNIEYDNCFVCSFYSHYITYPKEELSLLKNFPLEKGLSMLLTGLGWFLKWTEINKAVIVNNWLLSTNLYPALSSTQIQAITNVLKQRFPDHTIIFRTLNDCTNADLKECLTQHGYQMVGSRQVYIYNPHLLKQPNYQVKKMNRQLKKDDKLLAESAYHILDTIQLSPPTLSRMTTLYQALYLQKHSHQNPQFNQAFFGLMGDRGFLKLYALCQNDTIDGMFGVYSLNGVLTCPLLGYDTCVPQNKGLYRILTAQITHEGLKHNHILHRSSGVGSFKQNRGASAWIDYNAVFHQHLPFRRRLGWWTLAWLFKRVAIPLLRKYNL